MSSTTTVRTTSPVTLKVVPHSPLAADRCAMSAAKRPRVESGITVRIHPKERYDDDGDDL